MSNVGLKEAPSGRLDKNSIGVTHIVFFVVAAAAPMSALVGATPPAFAFGNIGVPAAFVTLGIVYLLFAIGFTAMTPFVKSAGGFYSYVTKGLGGPWGMAAAMLAFLAYFTIQIGIYAIFGVFVNATVGPLGYSLPWWVWSLALLVVVFLCGRQHVVFSGRLLGLCMIGEITLLTLFAIGVLIRGGGPDGLTSAGLRPTDFLAPGIGVVIVFVVGAFIGFEATAIFGEEAKDPARTIPRATYLAVGIITVFYAFCSWAIVQYYGAEKIMSIAGANLDTFYMTALQDILGNWAGYAMNILLLTSYFAALLSFHNTLNRYFFAFGRDGLVWKGLAKVHEKHKSPYVAGAVQVIIVTSVIAIFALIKADPYTTVFSGMVTVCGLSILLVQVLVAVAIFGLFSNGRQGKSIFRVRVAPLLSGIALAGAFLLVSVNVDLMTGSTNPLVYGLPALVILLAAGAVAMGLRIRTRNPALYKTLSAAFDDAEQAAQ
ncbi:amino acid permease [Rhizobium lusitanum]|uniref:Amino acid permease n=1 Tax=Rhizobium lusitanum TaxID=293958 RepID=A0A6L9UFH0_9HYPH|nr:APC family permease [Rhizobium lusitanum]NEI72877.1 amino acid permease [Rhizobium lusitanum]